MEFQVKLLGQKEVYDRLLLPRNTVLLYMLYILVDIVILWKMVQNQVSTLQCQEWPINSLLMLADYF